MLARERDGLAQLRQPGAVVAAAVPRVELGDDVAREARHGKMPQQLGDRLPAAPRHEVRVDEPPGARRGGVAQVHVVQALTPPAGELEGLVGRLDICWDNIPAARAKTVEPPRNYMRRIYVDTVVFRQDVVNMCVSVCGTDNVLYGSDYPHTIGDMAGCLSRVDALPGDVREKVRGLNAQRIFRL